MFKKYLNVASQIELLERRGMACDAKTAQRLMQEGYYSIINGYGKPFVDGTASAREEEDRYLEGTAFSHVYSLFSFDRTLRMLTFRELSHVESTLRAVASAAFLEAHPGPEDYLVETSYTSPRQYLLDERSHARNLRHTINTLSRYAHDHEDDERGRDDARIDHYRRNYDHVPLWVVFSDFSYGNLYHFIALMKRDEQVEVCERLTKALSEGTERQQLSRRGLVDDVRMQVETRNICAHGERLYDACLGADDKGYAEFVRMIRRFLTNEEWDRYAKGLARLVDSYVGISPTLDHVLRKTNIDTAIGRGPMREA